MKTLSPTPIITPLESILIRIHALKSYNTRHPRDIESLLEYTNQALNILSKDQTAKTIQNNTLIEDLEQDAKKYQKILNNAIQPQR